METRKSNTLAQQGAPKGKVGFFWIVPNRPGEDAILGDGIELTNAETYGEALTHPGGHYEFWENMKARGPAWLRARNVSGALLSTEYEDWPRGRVNFFPKTNRFLLLADPRIMTTSRIDLVRAMFELGDLDVDIDRDGHYRPAPSGISAIR
ncbi:MULTISPECIES: hypothetical protein [unclassified Mesorhizobium]|nr:MULTISPECIES: hypothetical protein [unclassified Mesorhizobium]RUV98960.1 hypothetical protein EOA49_21950 [Mesorhizobium sp. M1A.F.Ca.IN.020.04.1.1]RUW07804.1 hypothetical protein EOA53_20195 [Mesorhizobium sp. M1A.F.Ca.IN.020.03.1.1]RWF71657.1 MAG: hypothetical protein EOQ34_14755 [Mesorhizobium sp.]RWG11997.1 MAG: hypothetical protein EOQ58_22270 [Mesorhizobium sp.]RWG29055.1 MAG: hypothetical protein EOQ61_19470 [Mesorhizobium sp.]